MPERLSTKSNSFSWTPSSTDAAARAVTARTADDFDVRQDGKKQQVLFLQFVAAGGERTAGKTPATPSARDQQRLASGARHVTIVVDEAWMNFDDVVQSKEALRQFVATRLGHDATGTAVASLEVAGVIAACRRNQRELSGKAPHQILISDDSFRANGRRCGERVGPNSGSRTGL